MKTSILTTTALILVSLPALAGSSDSIIEQPETSPIEVSPWEFSMALYGWAEGINGDIGFLGRTASVDVGFSDIVKELDIGFMGAFELSLGGWITQANGATSSVVQIAGDSRAALESLYAQNAAARALGKKAEGVLVFPSIVKGGFIVEAQAGNGAMILNTGEISGF